MAGWPGGLSAPQLEARHQAQLAKLRSEAAKAREAAAEAEAEAARRGEEVRLGPCLGPLRLINLFA